MWVGSQRGFVGWLACSLFCPDSFIAIPFVDWCYLQQSVQRLLCHRGYSPNTPQTGLVLATDLFGARPFQT